MEKEAFARVEEVIAFIDAHLQEKITPESLAQRYYISLSQLYRDFYAVVGYSIKEYIRNRRISQACVLLKNSRLSLDYIVSQSGLETQQAFHKQFRKIVGMTPVEYRHSMSAFYFSLCSPPFKSIPVRVAVGEERIPSCRVIRHLDSQLSGMENRAVGRLYSFPGRIFGRNTSSGFSKLHCYEVMLEQDDGGQGKKGLYATCTVDYDERTIQSAWDYLYTVWLLGSMFEQTQEEPFEEYFFAHNRPVRLKLFLPVKRKKQAAALCLKEMDSQYFLAAERTGGESESEASRCVLQYLQKNDPTYIGLDSRFLVCRLGESCICGIEYPQMIVPEETGLFIYKVEKGKYFSLSQKATADMRPAMQKLEYWLAQNDVNCAGEPVFAIYERLPSSGERAAVQMTLYKKWQG